MTLHDRFDDLGKKLSHELEGLYDPVLIIIKGHLQIEEFLTYAIEQKSALPANIEDARLSFFQKIQLVRALYGFEPEPQLRDIRVKLFDKLDALNGLRNRLAHRLDVGDVSGLIRRLCPNAEYRGMLSDPSVVMELRTEIRRLIIETMMLAERYRFAKENPPA